MALPVVVLVAGDPVPIVAAEEGGFADLIRRAANGAWQGPWTDVDLRTGAPLPDPDAVAAVIVTGSASSVPDRDPWVVRGEAYLRELVAQRRPVFGICFGHQMLGQALGGHVARNTRGREIGTVHLTLDADDPVFAGAGLPLRVNMTHIDTIERLPSGARSLAHTERDPHAAVRFSETAWGVQFHPEMTAKIARAYVHTRREVLVREGFDPEALLRSADNGAAGTNTLIRFLRALS